MNPSRGPLFDAPSSPESLTPSEASTAVFSSQQIARFHLHAKLGNLVALKRALRRAPGLARTLSRQADALRLSAVYGHTDCLQTLLPWSVWAAGSREDDRDPKIHGPLAQAARRDDVDSVRLLLEHCDPERLTSRASTALLLGALHDRASCVEALLPHADLGTFWTFDQSVWTGKNALHLTAANGSERCTALLVECMDPELFTQGDNPATALMLAAQCGHLSCVRSLLPHCNVNACVPNGRTAGLTALMSCVLRIDSYSDPGMLDTAKLLWAAGDPFLRDSQGFDAFDLALAHAQRFEREERPAPLLWAFLDFVAPQMPRSTALQAVSRAPAGRMPHFSSLLEREALGELLSPPTRGSDPLALLWTCPRPLGLPPQ